MCLGFFFFCRGRDHLIKTVLWKEEQFNTEHERGALTTDKNCTAQGRFVAVGRSLKRIFAAKLLVELGAERNDSTVLMERVVSLSLGQVLMEGLLSVYVLSLPSLLLLQSCAELLFQVSPWLSAQHCSGTGFLPLNASLPHEVAHGFL